MKIIIINTTFSTIDNFTLKKFERGKIYDVRESVSSRLISCGDATLYIESKTYANSLPDANCRPGN